MKTVATALAMTALTMGLVAPGTAQAQADPEDIAQYYLVSVKPGSAQQFESAFKSYTEWRRRMAIHGPGTRSSPSTATRWGST